MKILLVNTNQAMHPYPVFPIGLSSIANVLKRAGHEVSLLDLCFEKNTRSAIRRRIDEFQPELIGAGIRNLDNSDLINFKFFLPDVRRMIEEIRSCSPAPLVAGGAAVSVMPKAVLEYLKIDLGVIGDGEQPFLDLVKSMESGTRLAEVPGVVGFENGNWFSNPKNLVTDYDQHGSVHLYQWIDVEAYLKKGSIYPVQSNRGCAFSCIYCTYTQIEGKRYRLRPAELVVEEIRSAIDQAGVDYFEFVDSIFNVPESHAKNICRAIKKARLKARFGAAGINPKWLSEELLDLMEEAGFSSLDITIESASPSMLRNLKKGFEAEDIDRAAAMVRKRKIKILWVFLVGGPGETDATLEESLDFIHKKVRPSDLVYVTSGLRIYPDTPLSEFALLESGISRGDQLLEPVFYLSPELGYEKICRRMLAFAKTHPNVMLSFDTDHKLIPAAYRMLHLVNAPRPYWQYTVNFNRVLGLANWIFPKAEAPALSSERLKNRAYYFHPGAA